MTTALAHHLVNPLSLSRHSREIVRANERQREQRPTTACVAGDVMGEAIGVREIVRANERQREQRPTTACVAGER